MKKAIGLAHIYTGVCLDITAIHRYLAEMFSILSQRILKCHIFKVGNLKN